MQRFRPVFELLVMAATAFAVHFFLVNWKWEIESIYFRYSVAMLYGIFFTFSLLITLFLIYIKQKNLNSVGNVFMLLTCLQAGFAFMLLHPILSDPHPYVASEKAHFYAVFAVFLTIETIVSVRMLNKA
jgi:hypothetical protein